MLFKKLGCLVKNPALAGEKECYPIPLLSIERNCKIVWVAILPCSAEIKGKNMKREKF